MIPDSARKAERAAEAPSGASCKNRQNLRTAIFIPMHGSPRLRAALSFPYDQNSTNSDTEKEKTASG
jgi:hypothetical protein